MRALKIIAAIILIFGTFYVMLDYASRDSRNFTINGNFVDIGEEPVEFDVYRLSGVKSKPEFWFHYKVYHWITLILDIREDYLVRFNFKGKPKYLFARKLKGGKIYMDIDLHNSKTIIL